MKKLSKETLSEFILADARLVGVLWENDGRDLCLLLKTGDNRSAKLTCYWARGVAIDLKYTPDTIGSALSWEAEFEDQGNCWRLEFQFPPQGSIEATFNEATLEYVEAP